MPSADEARSGPLASCGTAAHTPVGLLMRLPTVTIVLLLATAATPGCGDDGSPSSSPADNAGQAPLDRGEPVVPPFAVRGELEGLLIVWFDEDGPHTAERRSDIPEERRELVRIDSLRIAPEQRIDPDWVYVADLRRPGPSADYPVRKVARDAFDAAVDGASGSGEAPAAQAAAPGGDADVVIYGADWCGVCRSAARFFRSRGIAFVEKNIERDPAALREMQEKARRAGVRPSGIPVIDFRGTILTGFDEARIESLIEAGARPT